MNVLRKILLFLYCCVFLTALFGCGKNNMTVDTSVETISEEPTPEALKINADKLNTKKETEDEFPSVKGACGFLKPTREYELIGVDINEFQENSYALRFWFKFTNNDDSLYSPSSCFYKHDGITCMQSEEKLSKIYHLENSVEENLLYCSIFPGNTVVFSESFMMLNNNDEIKVMIQDDNMKSYNFKINPVTFKSVVPKPFIWPSVVSSYNDIPSSDEIESNGFREKVGECEIIRGTSQAFGDDAVDCVRVTYDITNISNQACGIYGIDFHAFQDGVELHDAKPISDYAIDTDFHGDISFPLNETVSISYTYALYNTLSPVMIICDTYDFDENEEYTRVYGEKIFDIISLMESKYESESEDASMQQKYLEECVDEANIKLQEINPDDYWVEDKFYLGDYAVALGYDIPRGQFLFTNDEGINIKFSDTLGYILFEQKRGEKTYSVEYIYKDINNDALPKDVNMISRKGGLEDGAEGEPINRKIVNDYIELLQWLVTTDNPFEINEFSKEWEFHKEYEFHKESEE